MIRIEMDMTAFIRFNAHVEKELRQAIRAGVNAAAVIGKKAFIPAAVRDIAGERVSVADVRRQVTPINRASAATLTASFTARNKGFQRTPTILKLIRGNQYKIGGGSARTFVSTGGGSNPVTSGRMFQINANGGRVLMVRTGSSAGRKRGNGTVKRVYAEGPGTAMGQEWAAPRLVFEIATAHALEREVSARVQTVLNGGIGSGNEGSDT